MSRDIVDFCLEHHAGTLVLGKNVYWKQEPGMGKVSNQKFVSMPIAVLCKMITYKAENAGIKVIEQEESYTSRSDVTVKDPLPVYGDGSHVTFSGRRIRRGLYRCADGSVINADCNGAVNILRKAFPDVWDGTRDFGFLAGPEVVGFYELNPKSIPVKGIGA